MIRAAYIHQDSMQLNVTRAAYIRRQRSLPAGIILRKPNMRKATTQGPLKEADRASTVIGPRVWDPDAQKSLIALIVRQASAPADIVLILGTLGARYEITRDGRVRNP